LPSTPHFWETFASPLPRINCVAFPPQGEENAYRRFIVFQAIHPRPEGLGFLA